MLESIFGNINKERVLLFIYIQGSGFAREMARVFGVSLRSIQLQIKNLEDGGVIVGFDKGRTREYQLNPRFYFLPELKKLLKKLYDVIPEAEKEEFYRIRRRPRRKGKP
jgi:predicted transcriptional regulator